jgi:hypothetical protein
MDHILAAAPAAAPGGAALGGAMLIVVVFVAITIYCIKHKGWDVPQVLMGYCLAIVVSGVTWGAAVNGAFSSGISAAMGAVVHAISNAG